MPRAGSPRRPSYHTCGAPAMKTLVTGGGGFLAGHLIDELLAAGHAVRAVELPGRTGGHLATQDAEVIEGDLRDPAVARRTCEGRDVVFHPAALCASIGPWRDFWATNVELTDHVIAGCREAGVRRLVHVSTASAVFDGTDHVDADETLPYPRRHLNHYSATKAESERRVLAANGTGLETVVLRPHVIWGPRDRTLLPRLIERARTGRVLQVGAGTNVVSTLYAENGAQALLLAATAERAPGQVYFVCDEGSINLWDFIRRILEALGLPPVRGRTPYRLAYGIGAAQEAVWSVFHLGGEPTVTRYTAAELARSHSYSIDRARSDLGYEPRVTRDEGLERFYEWAAGALVVPGER